MIRWSAAKRAFNQLQSYYSWTDQAFLYLCEEEMHFGNMFAVRTASQENTVTVRGAQQSSGLGGLGGDCLVVFQGFLNADVNRLKRREQLLPPLVSSPCCVYVPQKRELR